MPTYDYRCDACGHQFELFQSIKAEPLKTCAKCGADSARRVIGAGGGFIFKGSGFYITDYRSKDYQERARSDGAASGGSGSTPAGGNSGAAASAGGAAGATTPAKSAPPGPSSGGGASGGGGSSGASPAASGGSSSGSTPGAAA